MTTTKTEEYKGHVIEIYMEDDTSPFDPRDNDNTGIMTCFHNRYDLGDKHDHKASDFNSRDEIVEHLKAEHGAVMIFPLYLYDHSGLRMKIGSFQGLLPQGHAEFDSGCVGFIYANKESIAKTQGPGKLTKKLLENVRLNLEAEVEEYDAYLAGQVYGYSIQGPEPEACPTCKHVEDREVVDSCGGFLGWDADDEALRQARASVDSMVKTAAKKTA